VRSSKDVVECVGEDMDEGFEVRRELDVWGKRDDDIFHQLSRWGGGV
jgi:hypothetical protein